MSVSNKYHKINHNIRCIKNNTLLTFVNRYQINILAQ